MPVAETPSTKIVAADCCRENRCAACSMRKFLGLDTTVRAANTSITSSAERQGHAAPNGRVIRGQLPRIPVYQSPRTRRAPERMTEPDLFIKVHCYINYRKISL